MARSRNLLGPYELHPDIYILSSRDRPDAPLQRAGHADLVETADGETWMAYLCGRPLPNRGRCVMGRETAIQRMRWGEDGWLYTMDGQGIPTRRERKPVLPDVGPSVMNSTSPICRSTFNGCARPSPKRSSA